ncbi:phosphoglycerate kinase [Candidatus Peregrinibacteria bacterium]|nr:phosphoglycerate kinase [Candidatus Peregrinibacteria bacterium]
MSNLYSVRDANIKGKKVLFRVDFNVPIDLVTKRISDETRLKAVLPTIQFLLKKKAKIIFVSHLGRPNGLFKQELTLAPIASALENLLKKKVSLVNPSIGASAKKVIDAMKPGDMVMLENIRFYHEEEKNDSTFSQKLASLAEIYVNDAFGAVHRAHASTVGVTSFLPSFAGFLLEKEVKALSPLLLNPKRPFVMIIGGAKIDTKIGVLRHFIDKVDAFFIGGALANTFLKAQGYDIGASFCENAKLDVARDIMMNVEKSNERFILPHDVVVADNLQSSEIIDLPLEDVEGDMKIFDLGKKTISRFCVLLKTAKTVVWNGPLGCIEYPLFQNGTRKIAETLALSKATTILGGGDTLDALKKFSIKESSFTHVSTGGGAMLEFLEGTILPGIKVLLKK